MTSGYVAQHPTQDLVAVSMVNAALNAFVKAAALELDERLRIKTNNHATHFYNQHTIKLNEIKIRCTQKIDFLCQ
jgi:hypothetical protein